MNILVIKQTSLGDVLHSTGHVRALKAQYPDAHITLLTATSSLDLYRHNPWVDEFIVFDRYRIKREWLRHPIRSLAHIRDTINQVRKREFELAIDLQGLAKSVLFLYSAKSARKVVKGNWPMLDGYRDREQHAIDEMSGVLGEVGIDSADTMMEIHVGDAERREVDAFLTAQGIGSTEPMLIVSPFSRRASKDWPIEHFQELIDRIPTNIWVLVTGSPDRKQDIDALVDASPRPRTLALAGELNLLQFAELLRRAKAIVCGDSFPMHLAAALGTPLVSMLGPTDEEKIGPRSRASAVVLRADDCKRCDSRKGCRYSCLEKITPDTVFENVEPLLTRC